MKKLLSERKTKRLKSNPYQIQILTLPDRDIKILYVNMFRKLNNKIDNYSRGRK